jgi:hypothetical protein
MDEKAIIYILIAAAWGLYNLFFKDKKDKIQQPKASTPKQVGDTTPVDIEDLLGRLFDKDKNTAEKAKEVINKPQSAHYNAPPVENTNAENDYSFDTEKLYDELKANERNVIAENNKSLEEGQMEDFSLLTPQAQPIVEEKAENAETNQWVLAETDEIRKAIIWSEILKRPAWAN